MTSLTFVSLAVAAGVTVASPLFAQDPPPKDQPVEHVHDMEHMDMPMDGAAPGGWALMQDGNLFVLVNHQGGPRGGDELTAPNWWMGMATHSSARGSLTLTGMLSLDPATVGTAGYRLLFQVGEALNQRPIVDRQHPHDLWMQLSASWRVSLGRATALTLSGGPVGEPALGPPAFMHRASAAAIALAPLSHHTFDSTHVAFGVATLGVDRGPVTFEASVFNGREPDQRRWDFDFGRMDSVSGRVWFRPAARWEMQVSTGHLVAPEQLSHGNLVRTTASATYLDTTNGGLTAATVGVGMNKAEDVTRHAVFGEASHVWRRSLVSIRGEIVEVESALLETGELPVSVIDEARTAVVGTVTVGVTRDIARLKGVVAAVVVNGTTYRVPPSLHVSHGGHPFSFQVGLQIRRRESPMGRMWNMHIGGRPMTMEH